MEKLTMKIAWLLPKRLVYWCAIRMATGNADGSVYPGNPAERITGEMLKSHEAWVR